MTALPVDTPGMARWLLRHLDQMRQHQDASDAVDEICFAVALVRRTVDAPQNRTTFPVGPCPQPDCLGEVRAYIPADETREARLGCDTCTASWPPIEWRSVGRRILRHKATA